MLRKISSILSFHLSYRFMLALLFGCACITMAADSPNWKKVVDLKGLANDTAGWVETEWEDCNTGNEARVDPDGVLRLFPGPVKGGDSEDGRHGNVVSRPLPLYGDFDVNLGVRWKRRGRFEILDAWLSLVGADEKAGRSATIELRGLNLNVWPGKTEAAGKMGELPASGEADVRFLRQNGVLRIYWNKTLVGESEWKEPVGSLRIVLRTHGSQHARDSFVGIASLKVLADAGDLPVLDKPIPASEFLLAGGDFQERSEADIGVSIDAVETGNDGLDGLDMGGVPETKSKGAPSLGSAVLKGWTTEVDGKKVLWVARDEESDERAVRLEINGVKSGVICCSKPLELTRGREYILSALVNPRGKVVAGVRVGAGAGKNDRVDADRVVSTVSRFGKIKKYDLTRIPGNWAPVRARFKPSRTGEEMVILSARPAVASDPFGAVGFDKVVVREMTESDRLREEMNSALNAAMNVADEARTLGYKSEVAIDVAGFNVDDADDAEAAAKVKVQGDAFVEWIANDAEAARKAVSRIVAENGAVATFFDRLPDEVVRQKVGNLHSAVEKWQVTAKEWADRTEALRTASAALLPESTGPMISNSDWLANRFHLIWFNHYGNNPPGENEAIRYMGAMGATGYLNIDRKNETWDEYVEGTKHELDLLKRENIKLMAERAAHLIPHRQKMEEARESITKYLEAFGDYPAFGGFQFDEIHCGDCPCRDCAENFRSWIKKHLTVEELVDMGIVKSDMSELDNRKAPSDSIRDENLPLHIVTLEARAAAFAESVKNAYDIAHSIKPDVVIFNLLSLAQVMGGPFDAPVWKLADVSDMMALDPYWNGVPEEAYFMDLLDARMTGPSIITVGTHYGGNPRTLERDLAISFAHSQGTYVFDWIFCFKQPPYTRRTVMGMWNPPGKWDVVSAYAEKAAILEPYLLHVESPSPVALLHSDRSASVDYYKKGVMTLAAGRYMKGQMGLYCLLQQACLQIDPHYLDEMKPGTLAHYPVAVLNNAVSLTPDEEKLVREWVKSGGHLIATASTTIRDRWGRPQDNYGLADVFGVKYIESGTLEPGSPFSFDGEVQYNGRYDRVEPIGGTVTAKFSDRSPAVVENAFGKGKCVFIAAQDLGLNYTGKRRGGEKREYFAVYKTFNKGVKEFVTRIIDDTVKDAGASLPFVVRNCPDCVEVVMRVQKREGKPPRRILHLLNYGLETPVSGIEIEAPSGDMVKGNAVYPMNKKEVETKRTKTTDGTASVIMHVHDFDAYECILLE